MKENFEGKGRGGGRGVAGRDQSELHHAFWSEVSPRRQSGRRPRERRWGPTPGLDDDG